MIKKKNRQENNDKKNCKPMVWLDLLNLVLTYSLCLEKECNSRIVLSQTILKKYHCLDSPWNILPASQIIRHFDISRFIAFITYVDIICI
jgi:hypothetical protein